MKIRFGSKAHHDFFVSAVEKAKTYHDPYHLALFYTLGMTAETRRNIAALYDFKEHGIIFNGLIAGWQTGTSVKVTRLAFNLFNGFAGDSEIGDSPSLYTPYELFCNGLLPYCLEAVKLRYPEYSSEAEYLFKQDEQDDQDYEGDDEYEP